LKWGYPGYGGRAENPGFMHDIIARVGGPDHKDVSTTAKYMTLINTGHVVIDNTWLWRADHTIDDLSRDGHYYVEAGLVVNGDHVTGYGVAVEHTLGNMLQWNGNYGEVFFY